MSPAWLTITVLIVATLAVKIGPPLLLAGRLLLERLTAVIALLARRCSSRSCSSRRPAARTIRSLSTRVPPVWRRPAECSPRGVR